MESCHGIKYVKILIEKLIIKKSVCFQPLNMNNGWYSIKTMLNISRFIKYVIKNDLSNIPLRYTIKYVLNTYKD